MNGFSELEQQLAKLGEELGEHSNLDEHVLKRIAAGELKVRRQAPSRIRPRWRAAAAVAASVLVCVGVWWTSRPATLYARMLAALAEAETVHATGWTREIVRKWPLEKPLEASDQQRGAAKHEMELWYWTEPGGTPCSYERQGAVFMIRRGGDMKEYQADADLTFIATGGYDKDRVAEFERMAQYFELLECSEANGCFPPTGKEELGHREKDGRILRGLRLVRGDRVEEIWFDAETNLPARLTRSEKGSGEKTLELGFTVNELVPDAICDYVPPKTKHVRGGSDDEQRQAWFDHVAEIERRLEAEPIDGRVAVLTREDNRSFDLQYALRTPNGKYWVRPLDVDQYQQMTPAYFIDFHAATAEGERRCGTWRLNKEHHDEEIRRADLVYEAGVPWQEWVRHGLAAFGLESTDQVEDGTVWIAKHDGRALKPWRQVKPPVPYVVEGGIEKKGYVKPGIGHLLIPVTMKRLLADFNQMIDRKDLSADKPWIVDQTNLPVPPPYDENVHGSYEKYRTNVLEPTFFVATDAPYFVGTESLEMAREWYAKEFGITFTEEMRPVTVHAIQPK